MIRNGSQRRWSVHLLAMVLALSLVRRKEQPFWHMW